METRTKYILLGLAVTALGTGGYFFYKRQQRKRKNAAPDFEALFDAEKITLPPATTTPTLPNTSTSQIALNPGGFPLKKGSKGALVKTLQAALIKKFGADILPGYGADGHFGRETQRALLSKGIPAVIDQDRFTQIVASGTKAAAQTTAIDTTATQIASALHTAIAQRKLADAMAALKKIKSVTGYSAVNTIFKQTRIGFVRKTLLTALLERFRSSNQKKQLNSQFYRIGLKYDGNKWALAGLQGTMTDRLVTTDTTKIWDISGSFILVPPATILGEYLDANDGVTEFETIDGRRLFVPTASIRYAL